MTHPRQMGSCFIGFLFLKLSFIVASFFFHLFSLQLMPKLLLMVCFLNPQFSWYQGGTAKYIWANGQICPAKPTLVKTRNLQIWPVKPIILATHFFLVRVCLRSPRTSPHQ